MLAERAAKAEQERQDLTDRLTAFEAIARAAGAHLGSAEPDVVSEVPPSVIAAGSAPKPGGLPVVVDVGARKVVAVTGPAGDPRAWLPSIAAVASLPPPAGQVTKIVRAPMPAGLLAAVAIPAAERPSIGVVKQGRAAEPVRRRRPAHRRQGSRRHVPERPARDTVTAGALAVRVADTLTAAQARRAAVAAIRAARRNGWHASQTAAIMPVLAAAAGWHAAAIPVRTAIFAGLAAATATAAGVAMSVLPGHPVVPLIRVSPLPAPAADGHAHHHVVARRGARHLIVDSAPVTSRPGASRSRIAAPESHGSAKPAPTASPRASKSSSPSPWPTPSPSPSPTPSPSPSGSVTADTCVGVLIVNICVPL
ncbi:MAG TPA: hypothetical protein VMA73_04930 [Streptosporangiaceae bacterium]|nr:hypothetical protein [Streptosporangiaceae bacterium]